MIEVFSEFGGLSFLDMKGMMLHEADEHGLPVLSVSDNCLRVETEFGQFGIRALAGGQVRLDVASKDTDQLYALRDSLVEHIAHYFPEVAQEITWSDFIQQGTLAPNFQFATVLSSETLCSDFTRVKMRLAKTDLFDDRSIHFRFLFPQNRSKAPVWPTLALNGSTKWPQGDDALHRPVYTMRNLNKDIATVDIFRHEGGRTWEWSKTVRPNETVAMIGPGGSGVLDSKDVVLAADETAYPAAARMIESLPERHTARVVLLSHTGNQDYPMPQPDGTSVIWATPASFSILIQETVQFRRPEFLWVGAEASRVAALRNMDVIKELESSSKRLAAYWS